MGTCEPYSDWSLCQDDTGFPSVLPMFYMVSAVLFGSTGIVYAASMVATLRAQLREKGRLHYNTAMQMHAGVLGFSITAVCHDAALVTRDPSLPALPLLLLFHLRLICVAYVTTVLVRHWAVLHQQMGSNQRGQQPQLNVKIARFVELYRDGEVFEALLMVSFFLGTVLYGASNQDSWEQVERVQFLAWSIVSGVTCWLVTILGQRVHVYMRNVSRSRAMIAHVRRVYWVALGSSLMWCLCTVCFAIGAALDRPMSPGMWLMINSGINATAICVGILYFVVIGSKFAAKAAAAIATEAIAMPGAGITKVKQTYGQMVDIVSRGANTLRDGVTSLSHQMSDDHSSSGYINDMDDKINANHKSARICVVVENQMKSSTQLGKKHEGGNHDSGGVWKPPPLNESHPARAEDRACFLSHADNFELDLKEGAQEEKTTTGTQVIPMVQLDADTTNGGRHLTRACLAKSVDSDIYGSNNNGATQEQRGSSPETKEEEADKDGHLEGGALNLKELVSWRKEAEDEGLCLSQHSSSTANRDGDTLIEGYPPSREGSGRSSNGRSWSRSSRDRDGRSSNGEDNHFIIDRGRRGRSARDSRRRQESQDPSPGEETDSDVHLPRQVYSTGSRDQSRSQDSWDSRDHSSRLDGSRGGKSRDHLTRPDSRVDSDQSFRRSRGTDKSASCGSRPSSTHRNRKSWQSASSDRNSIRDSHRSHDSIGSGSGDHSASRPRVGGVNSSSSSSLKLPRRSSGRDHYSPQTSDDVELDYEAGIDNSANGGECSGAEDIVQVFDSLATASEASTRSRFDGRSTENSIGTSDSCTPESEEMLEESMSSSRE